MSGTIIKINSAMNGKSNGLYPAENLGHRLQAGVVSDRESASGSALINEL